MSTNILMEALGCKTVADLQKIDAMEIMTTASACLGMRTAPAENKKRILISYD